MAKKPKKSSQRKKIEAARARQERRQKQREAQGSARWKIKQDSPETAFRKVQRKYMDEPAENEKKNNLFKKRAAAAASGDGVENSTFSGGLLGSYQFRAFMRYYQDYWDDAVTPSRERLDKILENGDFDNLQEAWDRFAADPDNSEAMAVMELLAENDGALPTDSDDPLVARLLQEYDPDYPEGMFIDRITVRLR